MIELVVVYCLSADLTHCVEKRDPATSYGDPIACMMSAQLSAQAYLAEHPKWQLTRWRCEVDEPKRLPT